MANCAIILGASGTGKSTSIKGLDPKETLVFNVLGKRLPFKGSNSQYNKENKNMLQTDNWEKVVDWLQSVPKALPNIKNIVIDDSIYILRSEFFARAEEKGFQKYSEFATHFQRILKTCESLPEAMNVFFIMHSEPVMNEGAIIGYQVATVGKMVNEKYNPIECVPVLLFATVQYDDQGNPSFGFLTHRKKVNAIEIPAKTPDGMFEEDVIPNDLGLVVKAMTEYYC